MRALTGNSHGDGAGAVPGFSSTQVRVKRMKTEERRRSHPPTEPRVDGSGNLWWWGGWPWEPQGGAALISAEQEAGNAIKGWCQG